MVLTYMSRGRYREADSILATIPPDQLRQLNLISILTSRTGLPVEATLMRRASSAAASVPGLVQTPVEVSLALLAGQRSAADTAIARLEILAVPGSAAMARALRALIAGDTLRAAQELETLLPLLRAPVGRQARYDLGRLWLRLGNLKRANEYLSSSGMKSIPPLMAPTEFYLGQVHERLGNFAEARQHYARFVDWWMDCDPELRPLWEEGREGLARLKRFQ
jgi:tetratricopeptide (TPR) repeat protein